MSRSGLARLARIAIVLMAIALVACVVGPMLDDVDMTAHLAILCCVILVATAIFYLRVARVAGSGITALPRPAPRLPVERMARPPDLLALGVLLI